MSHNETATAELQAIAAPVITVPDAFIEAIKQGQAITAAATALGQATDYAACVAALPSDFTLHDLERFMPMRSRQRGIMTTRFIVPFAEYAIAYAGRGATAFVNPDDMTATAVLDLGTTDQPGHADNKAKLVLNQTAAYAALLHITSSPRNQQEVAEFLEDWAEEACCFDEQGAIKTPLAIAAVRKITIESAQKVESDAQILSATRSAFESIRASSKDPIPTLIHFTCQPYADLAERTFTLRLSVLTGDKAPKLVLRMQKAETHSEEMANELARRIEDAIGTELPVLVGQYSKAA